MAGNILVTAVGGDIGQGVVKCLRELPAYYDKLIGCDTNRYAAGAKWVDKFFIAPHSSKEREYGLFIDSLIRNEKIRYVFPINEDEIKFFNKNRSKYINSVKIFINTPFILDTFLDKYKSMVFLKEHKITCPKTILLSKYSGGLIYPFLIKTRHSYGGKGVTMVNSHKEFEFYNKKSKDIIVQEYIGSKHEEYTVGVFSNGGNIYSIAFRRYLSGECGGFSRFVELVHDTKITKIAEEIAKLTGLNGTINIQMRKINGDYSIFEINPRISSTVYFRHFFGFQDIKWLLDTELGKEIRFVPKYFKGVGVKAYTEVFFDME
ncbi:MAG: ATP-grasp domain-containing protein [archaeon]|nr:ATP-grasp domain-containing protein [Candidatus Micrarchaeota archaeon]